MGKDGSGKKIGTLRVPIRRKGVEIKPKSYIDLPLRLDQRGWFYATYAGVEYKAQTKATLEATLSNAVKKNLDLVWDRYLVIHYKADAHSLVKNGRHARQYGQVISFGPDDPRTNPLTERRRNLVDADDTAVPLAITSIELTWEIVEISRPYSVPEQKGQIRARRHVFLGDPNADDEADREDTFGDPREEENDRLPPGAVLYTPEREALLLSIVEGLRILDSKLASLFSGDADALAQKLATASTALLLGQNEP